MRIPLIATGLLLSIAFLGTAVAGPVTPQQAKHRTEALERLKKAIADEKTDEAKVAAVSKAMTGETDVEVRRRIVEMANEIPGPALEAFLATVLATDSDAGIRSETAKTLGKVGTENSIAVLAKAAASDRKSSIVLGDIGGESSARRASIFALAELAERFPKLADKIADDLRALPARVDVKDTESLGDARRQALFQVTHDEALLKPFFADLQGATARERVNGVVAFRFLKLKKAPAELVKALDDRDAEVRSWAALVLGEIGDPATIEPLMTAAADPKLDRLFRVNAIHSLGHMRATAAVDLMKKLADDPQVAKNAEMALAKIQEKKATP